MSHCKYSDLVFSNGKKQICHIKLGPIARCTNKKSYIVVDFSLA
jgi:hypothetical protein